MVSPEVLRRYPFFGILNDAQLKSIAMIADEEYVEGGKELFMEGQPANSLYLLLEGSVDLYQASEEENQPDSRKEFLVGEVNPGEPFGISAMIEPNLLTASARASQPSKLIRIDGVALRSLCEGNHEFAYAITRQVAKVAIERLNAARVQLAAAWA